MVTYKRSFITLIELLLVIAIMLSVAGLVGINIRKAFFEQRFRSEVSAVVDTLRLAQDLMLLLNADAHVLFADDASGQGIKYWIEVEKPLSDNWSRELMRKRPNLRAIHLVEMDDKVSTIKIQDKLDIKFLSGGLIMSQGILSLFSDDQKDREWVLKSYIELPGYPKPIVSTYKEIKDNSREMDMVDQLTRDMMNEIQQRKDKVPDVAPA